MKSREDANEPVTVDWIRAQPKAELHLHLLGGIRPETVFMLADRHGVDLPVVSEQEWRAWFRSGDLSRFVERFLFLFEIVRDREDFERVAVEVFEDLASDGVRHAEPRITLTSHLSRGVPRETVIEGLERARRYAKDHWNLSIAWIIDFPRILGPKIAETALHEAIRGRHWGVVGLDVAGYEASYGDEEFLRNLFERARDHGLKTTAHAGETGIASHVRTAHQSWKVDRIGHGTGALKDPNLVRELASSETPLEICPTSNLRLGGVSSLREHPLESFRESGVPITLNTDDPGLFGITLSQEIFQVAHAFGWDRKIVEEVIRNGWKYRFPEETGG